MFRERIGDHVSSFPDGIKNGLLSSSESKFKFFGADVDSLTGTDDHGKGQVRVWTCMSGNKFRNERKLLTGSFINKYWIFIIS